jgi:hypothetical protein
MTLTLEPLCWPIGGIGIAAVQRHPKRLTPG